MDWREGKSGMARVRAIADRLTLLVEVCAVAYELTHTGSITANDDESYRLFTELRRLTDEAERLTDVVANG